MADYETIWGSDVPVRGHAFGAYGFEGKVYILCACGDFERVFSRRNFDQRRERIRRVTVAAYAEHAGAAL